MAAIALLLSACAFAPRAWAQAPVAAATVQAAPTEPKLEPIAPADIPARADADEQFIQAAMQRAQTAKASPLFERALARQSEAVQQLAEQSTGGALALLPVRRLESLKRHWLLFEREFAESRDALARATKASAEDAGGLASRRATWLAAREAAPGSTPALLQRVDELVGQIDRAEKSVSPPLAKLLDLGRKASALSARLQAGLATVQGEVQNQDRRLLVTDAAPLWQAGSEAESMTPVNVGLRKNLDVEMTFVRDHDAANHELRRVLVVGGVLLLPLLLWLKRRAIRLVAEGTSTALHMHALMRPWAAWLVLVALGAVLYDLQGPIIRQQLVMLFVWVPVLLLLPPRVLALVGPWAWLSAGFYFLNGVVSMLVSSPLLYRSCLLGLGLLMLLAVAWLLRRAHRAAPNTEPTEQGSARQVMHRLLWAAAAVMLVAVLANGLGNVSLAAMLTTALLDSSYLALALYAGASVLVALFRVLLARPKVSRLTTRHTGSLILAAGNAARTLIALAWLVSTLQAFRIYGPLSDWLGSVLSREFKLGVMSLSLGGVVAFVVAAWLAFWLAKTIRLLLSDDILPALSLPRGVGNSISTLVYYSVLFLGLLTALAVAGFEVGQLAIVFGALGVGIGFGLQDIVKNFVSGLILMVERPVRPGDLVDVAGISGTVRDIGMRATVVTTYEGAALVVPNGTLLADKLVNWTLNSTQRRVDINVCTGLDVSPQRTMDLLVSLAKTVNGVAASPAPSVLMTGLVSGTLEYTLRAWTAEAAEWWVVRSTLTVTVRDGMATAGIELPLPPREVHLRGDPNSAAFISSTVVGSNA